MPVAELALLISALCCFSRAGRAADAAPGNPLLAVNRAVGQLAPAASGQVEAADGLGQLTFHNRRDDVLLSRAVAALQAGQAPTGLDYLQRIFDQTEDSFAVRGPAGGRISVRREAARLLDSSSPSILTIYEQQFGPHAQSLLEQARRDGDPALYDEIVRRFFHTSSGFAAADRRATRWLNHGQFALAARQWNRLLSSTAHRSRVTPQLRIKAALAHRLSNQPEQATNLLTKVQTEGFSIAGRTVRPESWLRDVAEFDTEPASAADGWPMFGGNPGRNASVEGSTSILHPLWQVAYAEKPNSLALTHLEHWEAEQLSQMNSIAVVHSPIIVGNRLVLRDFDGIRAVDLQSGERLWQYRAETSLNNALDHLANRLVSRGSYGAAFQSYINVEDVYAGNSVLGMLSSDGQRVYAIDAVDTTVKRSTQARHANNADLTDEVRGQIGSNRLLALALEPAHDSSAQRPVWSAGGPPSDDESAGSAGRSLAGHFFLGPPLPVEDRLFAVTEANRQLNAVALNPRTGEMIWSQGLSFIELPIEMDSLRWKRSCSPAFADGVLVFPTQLGKLVAVDALSGSLLWEREYDRSSKRPDLAQRRFAFRTPQPQGHLGFADVPQIHDRHVVYLPLLSQDVHCFNLFTGEPLWDEPAPRGDGEYIAAVTEDIVLVVGRHSCRGLSLETGRQQWETRLGMSSGRGLHVGPHYLVPLEEGRIASIEIATGIERGVTFAPSADDDERLHDSAVSLAASRLRSTGYHWRPGNLIAGRETIVSAGLRDVTAFPQAAALLKRMHNELTSDPPAVEQRVLAAELELALGDFGAARKHLAGLVAPQVSAGSYPQAENLLRETLYLELQSCRNDLDETGVFAHLEILSHTPAQRARYLAARTQWLLSHYNWDELIHSAHELAALDVQHPLPLDKNRQHLVSPGHWVRETLGRARSRFSPSELLDVDRQVDIERQLALSSSQIEDLRRFLALYDRWPQAAEVRMKLAEQLIGPAHFQEAELLLLRDRRHQDPQIAAAATRLLLELWDRLDIYTEAGGLLADLDQRFAEVRLPDGRTGREYVADFDRDGLTWAAFRRTRSPDWPVGRVQIASRASTALSIADDDVVQSGTDILIAYGRYRRQFVSPPDRIWHLLDKGSEGLGRLTMIHKETAAVVSQMEIPARNSYPSRLQTDQVGHLIPLGSSGTMHGISLLEYKQEQFFWNQTPAGPYPNSMMMKAGPAGTAFCAFQSRRHLIVVDPASGRILWQRTGLNPNSGLEVNPHAGLIGDEHVLALFADDRASYTVYHTATGEELHHGRLDINLDFPPLVFGRKLVFLADNGRLQVWDSLDDRVEMELPILQGPRSAAVTPDHELVVLQPSGRLQVIDVESGETKLSVDLEMQQIGAFNRIAAFSDGDRYYINLQRTGMRNGNQTYLGDRFLPTVDVQDDLFAVDRNTGRILWTGQWQQRTILHVPEYRLPFLVLMSRTRNRLNRNQQSLQIEIIDSRTGDPIAVNESLFPDRLVQLFYDAEKSRLLLRGLRTEIELGFGPAVQWNLRETVRQQSP
jgi:outer membrane protein assembly factor BamB